MYLIIVNVNSHEVSYTNPIHVYTIPLHIKPDELQTLESVLDLAFLYLNESVKDWTYHLDYLLFKYKYILKINKYFQPSLVYTNMYYEKTLKLFIVSNNFSLENLKLRFDLNLSLLTFDKVVTLYEKAKDLSKERNEMILNSSDRNDETDTQRFYKQYLEAKAQEEANNQVFNPDYKPPHQIVGETVIITKLEVWSKTGILR